MFEINVTEVFETWFVGLEEGLQDKITSYIGLLEVYGPQLSRPYVDTLQGSSVPNLKELRVNYKGNPYRILFAFDPNREGLLLVGSSKAGEKRWYEKTILLAEELFEQHLRILTKK